MLRKFFVLLVFVFAALVGYSQRLIILHTNDMHSKLVGFGPVLDYTPMVINNDSTIGGFARLATLIKDEKQKHPGEVLVLDAGDFLMGTMFHALEPQTGFELHLMKQMGYDFTTLGNHEFDFGPEVLAQIIEKARERGPIPQIVSASLKFSPLPGDDKLQKLYEEGVIKPYVVFKKNGLKIGIFGILGENAQSDIRFAAPLQFKNMVKVARKYTRILRKKEKVDIVICLSHSGIWPDGKGGYYGEDINLAKKVKGIDIIISGHTHIATPHYIRVGKTIIVQTGCYVHNLGRLEIEYKDGKVNVLSYKLIPVNDKIMGDSMVHKEILDQEKLIDKEILNPLGLAYHKPVAEVGYNIYRYNHKTHTLGAVGNLVTDAVLKYVDKYGGGTDLFVIAAGEVREDILKGPFAPPDAFRIVALGFGQNDFLGNPLEKIYLTGHELKQLMELLLLKRIPGQDSYMYISGMKVYYNPKGGFLNKIRKIVLDNGQVVDFSRKNKKLYSVTADSYLMSFIGDIKKMSYGLFRIIPKDKNGNPVTDLWKMRIDINPSKPGIQEAKEWKAIIYYVKGFKDINNDGLPDFPDTYKIYHDRFIKVSD